MKSPYRADLETILHGQYVPGEPLARVMLGDADEFAVIQIADKYSKRRRTFPPNNGNVSDAIGAIRRSLQSSN
jgi:hypothetical protein